jgi:hypothetical protein
MSSVPLPEISAECTVDQVESIIVSGNFSEYYPTHGACSNSVLRTKKKRYQ